MSCMHVYTDVAFVCNVLGINKMLISPIIPIMSVYRLPHGQYGHRSMP